MQPSRHFVSDCPRCGAVPILTLLAQPSRRFVKIALLVARCWFCPTDLVITENAEIVSRIFFVEILRRDLDKRSFIDTLPGDLPEILWRDLLQITYRDTGSWHDLSTCISTVCAPLSFAIVVVSSRNMQIDLHRFFNEPHSLGSFFLWNIQISFCLYVSQIYFIEILYRDLV